MALFLAGGFLLLMLFVLIARPYSRLARLMGEALRQNAPAGTTVGEIRARFPSTFELTDLSLPVFIRGQARQLAISGISGKISILPLFRGKVNAEMNGELFGGALWMALSADAPAGDALNAPSSIAVDARARTLDVSRLCEFLQMPVTAQGFVDADVEGVANPKNPTSLSGTAVVMGRDVYVPPITTGKLALPENRGVEFAAKLSARDGNIFVDEFSAGGTGYEISGQGVAKLADPVELSPLDGSFSVVFKENFTITDERLAGNGGRELAAALVASRGKVTFRLGGTIGKPVTHLEGIASAGYALTHPNP